MAPGTTFAALHRDMTPSQRAQVVVDINEWRPTAGRPRNAAPGAGSKTTEELAAEAGASERTIRQRAQVVVDINEWRPTAGRPRNAAPGAGFKTTEELAAEAGASERTIRQAKVVARNAIPELHQKVLQGDISVKAAAEIAAKPKTEQKRVLKEPRATKPAGEKTGASKWKPVPEDAPRPQVGASVVALAERDERITVLAEEVDRLTDRVAVLAAGGEATEEERIGW